MGKYVASAKDLGGAVDRARALASSATPAAGLRARNSGSVAGLAAASVKATNASGVRTGNRGAVWPSRSMAPAAVARSGRNDTAIPRTSWLVSRLRGCPEALDHRTSTGTGSPWKGAARHSAAASAVAVKVPVWKDPLACRARDPGCGPR